MVTLHLDDVVVARCECGKESRTITFRQLKNKWPLCECRQSMKVSTDATAALHSSDGMGNARRLSEPQVGKGSRR
jgi:hypothetical protein